MTSSPVDSIAKAVEGVNEARLSIRTGGSNNAYAYTEADDDGDYITVEDAKRIIFPLAQKLAKRTAQYDRMTDKYTAALKRAEDAARQAEAMKREIAEKDAALNTAFVAMRIAGALPGVNAQYDFSEAIRSVSAARNVKFGEKS